jgi:outer membrane lipoprotein-sorting protein
VRKILALVDKLDEKTIKLSEEEEYRGRKTKIYFCKDLTFGDSPDSLAVSSLFVDSETRFPVRIMLSSKIDGCDCKVLIDDIKWNQKIDKALFDLTPPNGFEVIDKEYRRLTPPATSKTNDQERKKPRRIKN